MAQSLRGPSEDTIVYICKWLQSLNALFKHMVWNCGMLGILSKVELSPSVPEPGHRWSLSVRVTTSVTEDLTLKCTYFKLE